MRKILFMVLIVGIVIGAQTLFFYRGLYSPPPMNIYDIEDIEVSSHLPTEFIDVHGTGKGTVLIDSSHDNGFELEDLNLLAYRIISRGYSIEYLEESASLEERLANASAYIVISPATAFSWEEVEEIKKFVDNGGRLMLIDDPTRPVPESKDRMNTLSTEFGIVYRNDYLYNLKENAGNFRYIYLTDFEDNGITKNLNKLVFYTACSISPLGKGVIFTDENTYSSIREVPGRYSPVVLTGSNVLAIGDLTFLTEPYNVLDNNQLISNIADFLTDTSAN
ncbi:MAG: DUF4350 domain-containing protein [Halobacteriota archaeon]